MKKRKYLFIAIDRVDCDRLWFVRGEATTYKEARKVFDRVKRERHKVEGYNRNDDTELLWVFEDDKAIIGDGGRVRKQELKMLFGF